MLTSGFCLQRVVCPCPGAIYMWKNIKNVYKIRIQRHLFETVTNDRSDKGFLLTSKVCSPGLYTCIKSFKMCLKSYVKEIDLKLATNGQSDKGFLLTSTFVPNGLSATGLGEYTCIKAIKYIPGPGVR